MKQLAQRLGLVTRDSDTLARIGGDEFILLMEDIVSVADAANLAQRLIEALSAPLEIHASQLSLSASIGIALYPDHGDAARLVTNADAAMYAAKRIGGSTYAVFQDHMNEGALEQLNLHNDLRHAIEHDPQQLQLYYQPKMNSRGGHVEGVEALLRWNHPVRGLLTPGLFIPLAERFGLINALGDWVIDEACRQMRAWQDQGLTVRVAINLSVHQLRTDKLAEQIAQALARYQIDPSHLLCEITESIAMEDIASTQRTFQALSRIGVFLAIDDFGTGYSSLSYLRRLPARQLKIDRSFIADIDTNPDARAIVSAVIRLSHELGLRVVAEGVETIEQRDILLDLRCDELQGFLLAHPMTPQKLQGWMNDHGPIDASLSGPRQDPPPFPT